MLSVAHFKEPLSELLLFGVTPHILGEFDDLKLFPKRTALNAVFNYLHFISALRCNWQSLPKVSSKDQSFASKGLVSIGNFNQCSMNNHQLFFGEH